jgi:hypothetical protein
MKIPKIIVIDEDKDKQLQIQSVDHSTRRKSPAHTSPITEVLYFSLRTSVVI